ncbi:MAG: hypothetical protein LBI10_05515 [Deltaproteobacteria bacterium]|jgi:hypothetical protein|nr:hypothetical protein [Deltaproteobacteria bacterium]
MLDKAELGKNSFVPSPPLFFDLRSVARERLKVVDGLSRAKDRLGKTLIEIGIRLDLVVSDVQGQSRRATIECLAAFGAPEKALEFASVRIKAPRK